MLRRICAKAFKSLVNVDFPKKVIENGDFIPVSNPVSPAYLRDEALSDTFIEYMRRWPGFVQDKG